MYKVHCLWAAQRRRRTDYADLDRWGHYSDLIAIVVDYLSEWRRGLRLPGLNGDPGRFRVGKEALTFDASLDDDFGTRSTGKISSCLWREENPKMLCLHPPSRDSLT